MTARPSHAMQQQEIDEALAALPGKSWRWLFTPDPRWLASVNTGTLREVNAVRMFVLVTVLWNGLGSAVAAFALGRCYWTPGAMGPGETTALVRRLCEESLATHRMLDFAAGVFDSYGILLGVMAGVAVGAMIGKRATDTPHRVAVEAAKKAPAQVITSEGGPVIAQPTPPAKEPELAVPNAGQPDETEEHQWRDRKPTEGLG